MSFEQISYLAQIVASVGVVISLIFVGLQIRQNTGALQRNEHNSTMAQWTVIRMAIAKNRDIAELMTAGLQGERALDAADQLRLEQMLAENAWASFHIWERTQRGIFPKGTFELSCGAHLCGLFRTAGGGKWWRSAKETAFPPAFVVDVDAVLAKNAKAYSEASVAVNKDSHDWQELTCKIARYICRLTFGVLAVFLGLGVVGCMCYNEFIKRLSQYGAFHWWEPFDLDRGQRD